MGGSSAQQHAAARRRCRRSAVEAAAAHRQVKRSRSQPRDRNPEQRRSSAADHSRPQRSAVDWRGGAGAVQPTAVGYIGALGRRAAPSGAERRHRSAAQPAAEQRRAAERPRITARLARPCSSGNDRRAAWDSTRIASRDRPHAESSGFTSAGLVLPSLCHRGAAPHSRGPSLTRKRARIARACACSRRVRVAQRARALIERDTRVAGRRGI